MNIYHTSYYQEYHRKQEKIIFKNFENENITKLENNYYIISKNYSNVKDDIHYRGSINTLYNTKNEEVFKWTNIDNNNNTTYYFKHSNNNEYLIYHEDLYGYSIIDLNTLEASHYIPKKSFLIKTWEDETFIWLKSHYIKEKNLLIVIGCLWAGPEEFIILDFKEPLKIQNTTKWLTTPNLFPNYYDNYHEVKFIKYENNNIHLKLTSTKNNKQIEKTIPCDLINKLLKEKSE